jgi:DNA polymerase/3'-5' exonuclease PolX
MYDGKTGEIISGIKTEQDIFNLIGIDYVDPQRR